MAASCFPHSTHPLFEIAGVFVRLDHIVRCIVNANHRIMRAAVMRCGSDCVGDSVSIDIQEPTEWQSIGNVISPLLETFEPEQASNCHAVALRHARPA